VNGDGEEVELLRRDKGGEVGLRLMEVKGTGKEWEVKMSCLPSRKCQTFAMCGTGRDSKAVGMSVSR
jgi:hypothetical protein